MELRLPLFLSPIDNMMPTVYAPILLFFPTVQEDPHRAAKALFTGFEELLHAMPILTCSITEPTKGPQKGALAATLPRRAAARVWRVRDFRGKEHLKFTRLREEGFPISRFPVWDFTILSFFFDTDPPAMHAQVTLIDGGLVLAICVHHSLADGTGFNVIARAMATCCRGEKMDPQDIVRMWTRPPILESSQEKGQAEDVRELTTHFRTQVMSKRPPSAGPILYLRRKLQAYYRPLFKLIVMAFTKYQALSQSTRMIHFPRSSLASLKDTALGELSTSDLLTALIFCCMTQSRLDPKRGPFIPVSTRKKKKKAHLGTFLLTALLTWLHATISFLPWSKKKKKMSSSSSSSSSLSSSLLSQVTAPLLTAVNLRKTCEPPVPDDYIGNLFFVCNVETPVLDLLVPSSSSTTTTATAAIEPVAALAH